MANIEVTLGGVVLPMVRAEDFTEITTPVEHDNVTLNGILYTDFVTYRRSWLIEWPRIHEDDYNDIRQVFNDQYLNNSYTTIVVPYYSINEAAKLVLNTKNIKFDGCWIEDFSIVVLEENAVS